MLLAAAADAATLALALAAPFVASLAARKRLISNRSAAARNTGGGASLLLLLLRSLPFLATHLLAGLALHRALLARSVPGGAGRGPLLRLAAAASSLTLCVASSAAAAAAAASASVASVRAAGATPPLAVAAAAAATTATALASLYSLDPGAGALLLPLCCWTYFSASLSVLTSRSSKKERKGRGEDEGAGEEAAAAAPAAAAKENGREGAAALPNGGGGGGGGGGALAVPPSTGEDTTATATTTAATAAAAEEATTTAATPPPSSLPLRPAPRSESLLPESFGDPRAAGFRVRGPHYFSDRLKIEPADTRARLSAMELLSVRAPTPHIARLLPSIRDSAAPFTFVWQVLVPGRPNISMACAWELDYDPVERVRGVVEAKRAARARGKGKKREKGGGKSDPALSVELSGVSAEAGGLLMPPSSSSPHPPSSADRATGGGGGGISGRRRGPLLRQPFTVGGHRRASTAAGAGDADAAGDPFGFDREERSGSGAVPALAPVSTKRAAAPASSGEDTEEEDDGGEEEGEEGGEEEEPDLFAGCDPFDLALARFIEAGGQELGEQSSPSSIKERHARFKIIPRIEVGPWVVKRAVGQNTPVLLGNKITTRYFRGPRYLEVDSDVGSSRSAAHVVALVQGALRNLEISIAVLLEGREGDELPESLLGTVALHRVDLARAPAFEPE